MKTTKIKTTKTKSFWVPQNSKGIFRVFEHSFAQEDSK